VAHETVEFSLTNGSTTVPHAIQVDLIHAPDANHGGTAGTYAHVVNPTGFAKSVSWSTNDTGTGTRVILIKTPTAKPAEPDYDIKDFKFYVAGGIEGLNIDTMQAFDSDGNPVSDVAANLN
jgi:hypothetical protein